jgi:FAD/FMN-containing dehydrogenase
MATAGTVGVVGYTLGGGIGPMARRFGFAADHVTSIDVVTADGVLRTVDAEHGADLFWALLGGKYGFGIVTAITMRLIPAPELFAATVVYAAPDIDAALRSYANWAAEVPQAMGSTAALMRMPDLPQLPQPLRGQTVLQIDLVFVGDAVEGERWTTALIGESTPMMSHVGTTDPAGWLNSHPAPPPMPSWQRGQLLESFSGETVSAIMDVIGPDRQVPLLGLEIRPLGGALTASTGTENSVGGRQARFLLNALGAPVPELFGTAVPGVINQLFQATVPWSQPGSQLNFHGLVDEQHPVSNAWPAEIVERLAGIRRRHDPAGVFGGPIAAHR